MRQFQNYGIFTVAFNGSNYYYFIENGTIMNFMTGNTSLEHSSVEVVPTAEPTGEPAEPNHILQCFAISHFYVILPFLLFHIIINGLMLTVDHYSCYSSQKYNKAGDLISLQKKMALQG